MSSENENQPEMTPHVKKRSLVGFEPTTFDEHELQKLLIWEKPDRNTK
jgi:hypothetical protein